MPPTQLLDRLDSVMGQGPWLARCPAHRDRTPSLSITVTGKGITLLHCHAGCEIEEILSAVGLRFSDLYPPRESHQTRPAPIERSAHLSLQTIAHAALVAATLLGAVARAGRCTEAQAGLAVRLALDIQKALDAAGIKAAVLSERKRV